MKFLLLGNGKSIKYIKKYIKFHNDEYVLAVFKNENVKNSLIIDEKLLDLNDIDYVIKSPGIKQTSQIYLKLKMKFKFINELDLLHLYNVKTKTIVVTGSNGKTTFVSMLKYLFDKLKIKSILCGNSFCPITKYYKKFDKVEYLIIEQSSFQLHNLSFYKPYISLILNLSENHLDSSYSLNQYHNDKKNIYKYLNKNCFFITEDLQKINTNGNIVNLFSYDKELITNKDLIKYSKNFDYIYTICKLININEEKIKLLNGFKALKYRETIKKVNDITFINDSKSTSIKATLFALSHIDNLNNTILIIGGINKNLDYKELVKYKVNKIICYGSLCDDLMEKYKHILYVKTLKQAFYIAINLNIVNKIILFSPSAASFDQFKNYKDRGKHFDRLIKKYGKK